MAITKTNFIDYTRCRRYSALENIRKDKLDSKMTIEEYMAENEKEEYRELLGSMFESTDEGENDLTKKEDKELSAMMKYYKEVELESAFKAKRIFNGKFVYSENTYNQESFDFVHNGIRYLCYVDIYNESDDEINIIEVKSTTSRNYIEGLKYGENSKEKRDMFILEDGIYKLNKPSDGSEKLIKKFNEKYKKLFDRYSDTGRYVFDLAVQRYIIENDLKSHNIKKRVNYYLSVLNHNYVYDGYMIGNKRIYRTIDGEDIVSFFDMNEITKEYMPIIESMVKNLENNIYNSDPSPCNVGVHCSYKEKCECKYRGICYKNLPEYNASFNYIGFTDRIGLGPDKYNKYDLINNG